MTTLVISSYIIILIFLVTLLVWIQLDLNYLSKKYEMLLTLVTKTKCSRKTKRQENLDEVAKLCEVKFA